MRAMRIEFRLVDVFTERPLAGNQLCVVPEGSHVPDELMQALAREIGFSETTFVTEAGGDRYAMRIFTPDTELPFAGHPSLGTAFVLRSEGRIGDHTVQTVAAGEYRVDVDLEASTAWMEQGAPELGPGAPDLHEVAEAVGLAEDDLHPGLPPQVVSAGLPYLLVGLVDPESLGRARPNRDLLHDLLEPLGTDGYYLYFFDPDSNHARARMFGPWIGISEDPATGSAAGPLGAYLARRGALQPGRLTIAQGVEMGRPSALLVDVAEADGDVTVSVGGGVAIVGGGYFDIPS
jgi:trans-2,3-dihydro-3-hydroxyanthranilate isomerase